jgi:mono/diheme cytochrome c family protein
LIQIKEWLAGMGILLWLSRCTSAAAVLCALALFGCIEAGNQSQLSPQEGKRIAEDWCSECHQISPDQPSGMRRGHVLPPPVAAPGFMQIAAKPNVDEAYLKGFVSELHLPMPTFRLSEEQQQEVITYILSLKTPP